MTMTMMMMTNAITYLRSVKVIQSCALKTASHVEGYALRAPPNLALKYYISNNLSKIR
jgi:hypothetical protein